MIADSRAQKPASEGATPLRSPQGLRPEIARIIETLARAAVHRDNRTRAATGREGDAR